MARSKRSGDDPGLFDLPLDLPLSGDEEEPAPAETAPAPAAPTGQDPAPPADGTIETPSPSPPLPRSSPSPSRSQVDPLPLFEDLATPEPPLTLPVEAAVVAAPPAASPTDGLLPLEATGGGEEGEEDDEIAEEPTKPRPARLEERFLSGLVDLGVHAAILLAALIGADLLGAQATARDAAPLALFLGLFSALYCTISLAFWGATPGMAWQGLVAVGDDGERLSFPHASRRWLAGLATTALLGLPLLPVFQGRALSDWATDSRTFHKGG